jgi:transcriptional regulator of arginine metabolism
MTALSPVTKAARHARIAEILGRAPVRSQEELAELLAECGVRVTQATLSRDLDELEAVRLRGPGGALVYALPGEPAGLRRGEDLRRAESGTRRGEDLRRGEPAMPLGERPVSPEQHEPAAGAGVLGRIAPELLVSAEASANLVVARTPPGGAQLLASALDHAGWESILGTVAGDDTVLVITREPGGGDKVAHALVRLAERRSAGEAGRRR